FDLNLFIVFEAIYRHGNLTHAARGLNLTQPAVSNALARLRDRLEDPLFVHAGGKMNPTPTAQRLIAPVRQALRLLQGGVSPEEVFDPMLSDRAIRIGIGDIGETILLPKLVCSLAQKAPEMRIQAIHVPRRSIPKKLAIGELDFAVDIPLPLNPELMQRHLMSDAHVCAVGRNHPLATKGRLTMEDYLAHGHIHVSSRQRGAGIVDIELGHLGPSRRIAVRLQHYQAAFHMLAETDYLLTAPARLTQMYDCHVLRLPLAVPTLDFQLYWHVSTHRTKLNEWLRAKIYETMHA
ncbi:MAG: LysR family transcriptional regulator, partial [Alphaproteobacteria bacterium]